MRVVIRVPLQVSHKLVHTVVYFYVFQNQLYGKYIYSRGADVQGAYPLLAPHNMDDIKWCFLVSWARTWISFEWCWGTFGVRLSAFFGKSLLPVIPILDDFV
jgi:hypothetical protein